MEKEEYSELIEKYLVDTITEEEKARLADWFVNDRGVDAWWAEEINEMSDRMNPQSQARLQGEIKAWIVKKDELERVRMECGSTRKFQPVKLLKWAAIICIPVLLAVSLYVALSPDHENASSFIVQTECGERSSVTLPDGTSVKLNSASTLVYRGNLDKERRVELNGEAYFNVTHDPQHPFVVALGKINVKVLGTSFNISSYENMDNITVVLLKGRVEVLSGNKAYAMNPDDKLVYDKSTSTIHSSKVYPDDYIEWTKGGLYFENETLENIAQTLSRTYNVNIRFDSEELKKERFTGTVGNGGIQNVLERLTMASPFVYEMKDSVIILKQN